MRNPTSTTSINEAMNETETDPVFETISPAPPTAAVAPQAANQNLVQRKISSGEMIAEGLFQRMDRGIRVFDHPVMQTTAFALPIVEHVDPGEFLAFVKNVVAKMIDTIQLAEREACARICDEHRGKSSGAEEIGRQVRSRQ